MTSPDPRQLRATSQMTEAAIIGCAISGHVGVVDLVLAGTSEEDFIDQDLRTIRSVMDEFAGGNPTADVFARALEREGKLEAPLTRERLRELIELGCVPIEVEWQMSELRRLSASRAMIHYADEFAANLSTGPSAEGMTEATSKFIDLMHHSMSRAIDTSWVGLHGIEDDLDFLGRYENTPIATGLKKLDAAHGNGLRPGTVTVLAGSTTYGKSSLGLGIALTAAADGHSTAFFTVEMSSRDVRIRAYGAETGISHTRIRNNELNGAEMDALIAKQEEMKDWPLMIEHRSHLTVPHIRAMIQRMNAELAQAEKPPISLVVIDYLQLLAGEGSNPQERVARNSWAIAQMAKDEVLNRPAVLVLSQLKRAGYGNARPPSLDDLRESGAIAQDADSVLILDVEGREDQDEDDEDVEPGEPVGKMKIRIAKNREGARCVVPVYFQSNLPRFDDVPDGGADDVGGKSDEW